MTTPEIQRDVAILDLVREHLAGRHNSAEEFRHDCLACDRYRLAWDVENVAADLAVLRGRVVSLLGQCDAIERLPDYDPDNASVTVREIRHTFAETGDDQ